MDLVEKMGVILVEKGKVAVDKAKLLSEMATVKGRMDTCEEVLKKNYMEIGKMYCEKYGEQPEERFEKQCRAIRNAAKGKQELEAQLEELKKQL